MIIINKNKKKFLAVLLSLFSVGKFLKKDICALPLSSNFTNKFSAYYPYLIIPMGMGVACYFNSNSSKKFFNKNYEEETNKFETINNIFNKNSEKKDIKFEEQKIQEQKINKLEELSYNPFVNIIPHYHWQDCNCFFLSSLYTLYGPENQNIYDDVANTSPEFVNKKTEDFCKKKVGYASYINKITRENYDKNPMGKYDEKTGNLLRYYTYEEAKDKFETERIKKLEGFIELCKIFNRQKNFDFNSNKSFKFIPKNFKNKTIEFEEKVCGQKLLKRDYTGGSFSEVISCFTSEAWPFLIAQGDQSIYANWAIEGKNADYKQKIRFSLPSAFAEIEGPEGNRKVTDKNVEVGEDGKITVNNQNYYLVSISQTYEYGEGHAICIQPKYEINKNNNNIYLSAALKLNCLASKSGDKLYKCSKISEIMDKWGSNSGRGIEYSFRFVPENIIREYQDYYCYNN